MIHLSNGSGAETSVGGGDGSVDSSMQCGHLGCGGRRGDDVRVWW